MHAQTPITSARNVSDRQFISFEASELRKSPVRCTLFHVRLGELLIKEGHATSDQIDEALSQQVFYGGRLGTTLVQMGVLHLDTVAAALGQQHHLASALTKHFDSADRTLQSRLSAALAAELLAIPMREELPGIVAVAFADPPNEAVTRRVSSALGAEIVPVIAPELRLRYQLEAVYGVTRSNRFLRVRQTLDKEAREREASGRERRRYVRPLTESETDVPAAMVPDSTSSSTDDGTLGKMALQQKAIKRHVETAPKDTEQIDTAASLQEAQLGMRRATDRDRVVDLAVSCMREGFGTLMGAGVFFLCRQDMASGWKGFSEAAENSVIQTIAIPLALPSVLKLSYQAQVLVCGKPPVGGRDIDARFWHVLGCTGPPAECVVAPIKVVGRVVCLLYCHARDLGPIPEETSHAVAELADTAGNAFMRLIRSSNR